MKHAKLFALGFGLALAACASGGSGASATPSAGAAAAAPTRTNVITAAEISRIGVHTVAEAILSLRPHWDRVNVYLNDQPYGRFERLEELPVDNVKEIRMLTRPEARARYNPEAQASILVVTK